MGEKSTVGVVQSFMKRFIAGPLQKLAIQAAELDCLMCVTWSFTRGLKHLDCVVHICQEPECQTTHNWVNVDRAENYNPGVRLWFKFLNLRDSFGLINKFDVLYRS